MNYHVVTPAYEGAGAFAYQAIHDNLTSKPDKFERLAINLSQDEIRTMVLELMG